MKRIIPVMIMAALLSPACKGKSDPLAVMKKGSSAWQAYRKDHPNDQVRLANRNTPKLKLAGGDFKGVDLSGSMLYLSDFRGADFSGANLRGTNLSGSDLRNARMARAILQFTNFGNSKLDGVDISRANICGRVFLAGASMTGTNLRGLPIPMLDLTGTDLGGALIDERWKEMLRGARIRNYNAIIWVKEFRQ